MSDKPSKISTGKIYAAGGVFIDPKMAATHKITVDGEPLSPDNARELNGSRTVDAATIRALKEGSPPTSTPQPKTVQRPPKIDMAVVAEPAEVDKQPTPTPQPRSPRPYIDLRRFNKYNTELLAVFGKAVKSFSGQGKDVDLRCKFVVAADLEDLVFDHQPLVDESTVVCGKPHEAIVGATLEITEAPAPFNGFIVNVNNTAGPS